MSDNDIREDCGDKQVPRFMIEEIMKALDQSNEAAYRVYLLLCKRFGAGQGI